MKVNINNFANQYQIDLKYLQLKSFYSFHKCQYICYSSNTDASNCIKQCQTKLDKFISQSKKTKDYNDAKIFMSPSNYPNNNLKDKMIKFRDNNKEKLKVELEVNKNIFKKYLGEYFDKDIKIQESKKELKLNEKK